MAETTSFFPSFFDDGDSCRRLLAKYRGIVTGMDVLHCFGKCDWESDCLGIYVRRGSLGEGLFEWYTYLHGQGYSRHQGDNLNVSCL